MRLSVRTDEQTTSEIVEDLLMKSMEKSESRNEAQEHMVKKYSRAFDSMMSKLKEDIEGILKLGH